METNGRKTIFANYTERQLLSGNEKQVEKKVLDILKNSIELHEYNRTETKYLGDYLYGIQDIKDKVKLTRTDINNKGVENWAWAFKDWKQAFLLGKPIQYAPLDDKANEEITLLNKYNVFEDKDQKDQELYEDIFTAGRGYRFCKPSKVTEDDETPFNIVNLSNLNTEVVYSSSPEHEQLLAFVVTDKKHIVREVNPETGKMENIEKYYNEYTVYTRNRKYTVDNKLGVLRVIKSEALIYKIHLITEYYMNRRRMGWLEIGKDIFDDINYIENLDLDDIESFVNSIMVFTNAEVNKAGMDAIKEYGAVSIKSTDTKKASVELLQSRLKSLDSQTYYMRKLSALHSILSVPQANSNGDLTNAETGKGFLTGQGFTSSSVRVENEEKAFRRCDRTSLKVILKLCKEASKSKIKNLKISDIDIKFSRDLSDNILTKTQALINLATANIPPEIRNSVIGLFSDPVSVTEMQKAYEEEKRKIQEELDRRKQAGANQVNEQNNKMQDASQLENQGQ